MKGIAYYQGWGRFFLTVLFVTMAFLQVDPLFSQEQLKKILNPAASERKDVKSDLSIASIHQARKKVETELAILEEDTSPDEFSEDRRGKLEELVSLYAMQETALTRNENTLVNAIQVSKEVQKIAERSFKGLPENSFLGVIALERSLFIGKERLESAEATMRSSQQLVVEEKENVEKAQANRRLLQEKVESSDDPMISDQQKLSLLRLEEQIYLQMLELRKLQVKETRSLLHTFKESERALRKEFESRFRRAQFSEDDLKTLQGRLEVKIKGLEKSISKVNRDLLYWERVKFKKASKFTKRGFTFIFNEQIEALSSHKFLLKKLKGIWEFRYKEINKSLNDSELEAAREEYQRSFDSLRTEMLTQTRTLNLLLREERTVESRTELSTSPADRQKFAKLVRETISTIGQYVSDIEFSLFLLKTVTEEASLQLKGTSSFSAILYSVTDFLGDLWHYELWSIDDTPITLGKIIIAFLLLALGVFASRYIARKSEKFLLTQLNVTSGPAAAVHSVIYYVLLILFTIAALQIVHIPLTIFTLAGGALAIGVGFGSQNIVNNFFSGLILFMEQPIRVGDIIEFAGMRGTVVRIGSRSTMIQTPENMEVFVPNSILVENSVTNWTKSNNRIRRSIKIGLAYGSDTRKVDSLLNKIISEHGVVLKTPSPEVLFRDFGDNALNFEVRFWVAMRTYGEVLKIESNLRHMINSRFNEEGLVIAFPQRDVHLDVPAGSLKVELSRGR